MTPVLAHFQRRVRRAAGATALVAVLAPGPGTALAEPATGPVVRIDNFTFNPAIVTVAPGTTVTWINGDDIPHTVVSSFGHFRSKTLDTDDRFVFTFTTEGAYPYFCSLHPHMIGKVVVRDTPE